MAQTTVLITCNVQKDFCAGGAYPLKDWAGKLRAINNLREHADFVVHARLTLQPNHFSFRSSNPGSELEDPVKRADAGYVHHTLHKKGSKKLETVKECIINPYCVRGTKGAEFHPDLVIREVCCLCMGNVVCLK